MSDRPLRIAAVLPRREAFSPRQFGAVALCAWDNARFSRHRNGIVVFGGRSAEDQALPDVAYRLVPTPARRMDLTRTGAWSRNLLEQLRRFSPHLVEVHNRPEVALRLAAKLDAPVCLHFHNDPRRYVSRLRPTAACRNILHRTAAVYCVSDFVRRRLVEGIDGPAHRAVVIPNGIDTAVFRPAGDKQPMFVFAGRMIPEKGALAFAQAAAAVLPRLSGWQAVAIGPLPAKGDYGRRTVETIESTARGRFLGFRPHDEVKDLMAQAAVAVLPSCWQEPFGRTVLEAMACGCAVITCDVGAIAEVAGQAAVYVPPADTDALADAMAAVAADSRRVESLGRRARRRACQLFDIRSTTARLDAVRQQVAGAPLSDDHHLNEQKGPTG